MWLTDSCLKLRWFEHRVLLWIFIFIFQCVPHGHSIYILDLKLVLWTWICDSIWTQCFDFHVWVINRDLFLFTLICIKHIDLLLQDDKAPLTCVWQLAIILLLQETQLLICIFWAAELRILPVMIDSAFWYLRTDPFLLILLVVFIDILFREEIEKGLLLVVNIGYCAAISRVTRQYVSFGLKDLIGIGTSDASKLPI